ncbi:MAG: UDP-3-O-(3-hydroxymyristoyl)glucosamine N-acyltransferase [Bryobacterales bacterium]|nr:UDP-3-O-(3-hydroxymyristoyl)glucosamine N-acyltransferase [Bryobacterales bacterium]
MRVREMAEWLGCTFEGDGERAIAGVADLEAAGCGQVAFVGSRKAEQQAQASAAGCLLVSPDFVNRADRTVIRTKDPRGAFARLVHRFHPADVPAAGVHPTAVIGEGVELGEGVAVGPRAVVGAGSKIGARSAVGAGSVIGKRVTIGADSRLHANVTLYDDVDIGERAVLHSGCVIGADGFGFAMDKGRWEKFPQVGRVHIGDDCEIGANSTIDRAALGVTWVGDGVKIDNMVHVGHNCRIGNHVVVAAQTGFSGAVVVEDYAVIGGQVGIGDKARIESRAVLGSGCGVLTAKVIRSGEVVWGTPARPLKEILEQLANVAKLPSMRKELLELKKQVARLLAEEKR